MMSSSTSNEMPFSLRKAVWPAFIRKLVVLAYMSACFPASAQGSRVSECDLHEFEATQCIQQLTQYAIKRSFMRRETNGFAYEFQNRCNADVRVIAWFDSGNVKISAKISSGEYEVRNGSLICEGRSCEKMESFAACSTRLPKLVLSDRPEAAAGEADGTAQESPPQEKTAKAPVFSGPKETPKTPPVTEDSPKLLDDSTRSPTFSARLPVPVVSSAPSAPSKRQFVTRSNWDLVGVNLKSIVGVDANECKESCAADANCVAYTADRWNRRCFLKQRAVALRFEPKATSGWRDDLSPPQSDLTKTIELYRNRQLIGRPLDAKLMENSKLCSISCLESEQCVGFSFTLSTRQCSRFIHIDNYNSSTNEVVAGIKRQLEPVR